MEGEGGSARAAAAAAAATRAKRKRGNTGGGLSAAAAAKKKKSKKTKKNGGSVWRNPARVAVPLHQAVAGDAGGAGALRSALAAVGATAPSYVVEKTLGTSDVSTNQARLLLSCKGRRALQERSPLTPCFTAVEAPMVAGAGLLVTAIDRAGRSYQLQCRFLTCNLGYRFITGWKAFVESNGLHEGQRVELWAFRSRQLPNKFETSEDKKTKVAIKVDSGHPDGSLALVLLDYPCDAHHPQHSDDEEEEEEEVPLAPEVKEMEMAEAGRHQHTGEPSVAPAAPDGEKLGGGGGGGQCAQPTMTIADVARKSGLEMALAVIALITLRRCERQDEQAEKHEPKRDGKNKQNKENNEKLGRNNCAGIKK